MRAGTSMRCASELNRPSGSFFALSTPLKSPSDLLPNVRASVMVPSSSSHQHGPPLLSRVRLAGPFPDVKAPMQPADSLPPSATSPVPLDVTYPGADACSVPQKADDPCARLRVVRRRRVTGSPLRRGLPGRGEGLPGYGTVLFVRAVVEHPAGYTPLLALFTQGALLPLMQSSTSASGKPRGFGAAVPRPARSHAYASPNVFPRSAPGWFPARAGSPLAGQVSHPLDMVEPSPPPIHLPSCSWRISSAAA